MFKKILVPVDLSHGSLAQKALNHAAKLKDTTGHVSVVHVTPELPSYVAAQLPKDIMEETRAGEKRELQELVEESDCNADIDLRTGPVARNILAKAKGMDADLIIIGSHDPSLQDYLIGSTAATVVRNAKCTVMVIH